MAGPTRQFAAAALVGAGALILALCGPCTALFAGGALFSLVRGEDAALALQILFAAAVLGGPPCLGGYLLLRAGLRRGKLGRDS